MPPRAIVIGITLLIWTFFLWKALHAFGPDSNINNVSYNSDSAIPVLMSNEQRPFTVFSLYYYGADRWGGWPFMLTRFVRWTSGYHWTDKSVFAMQTVWIFVGLLVFSRLSPRWWMIAGLAYLIPLTLHGQARYIIFELSQLYAWQVTALLLAWYALRRTIERRWAQSALSDPNLVFWEGCLFLFSFLAIWSSIAAIPFILCLWLLETIRIVTRESKVRTNYLWLKIFSVSVAPILLAIAANTAMKMNYRRHSLKHYGQDFHTTFSLDRGNLKANLGANLHIISDYSWWFLYLLPIAAALLALVFYLYAYFRRRETSRKFLTNLYADDTVVLAIGSFGIAAINFILVVITDHVRISQYDTRFLAVTNQFGPTSGLLVLCVMVRWAMRRVNLAKYAMPALVFAGLLLLAFKFPGQTHYPEYDRCQETALALAERSPHGILLGGYWQTYVLVSMQPGNTMTPVPVEVKQNRMPWTSDLVFQANEVIVEYRESNLGEGGKPPESLALYQNSFRLVEPNWYENGTYAFARYVKKNN